MNHSLAIRLLLMIAALTAGSCSSSTPHADGGAGVGGGGRSGSGGQAGAANAGGSGGHAGVGGSGAGGLAGGAGGQVDAGACRMQSESCSGRQQCCGPLICTGICTMGVNQQDASGDASLMCSYPDGGAPDGAAFQGICPAGGCPSGTVCVVEVGGVAGGGGEYCAPIALECHGTPTCSCMADCVCTNGFGGRPEACSDQNGLIACDNGIR
jgi:hypothetical protein